MLRPDPRAFARPAVDVHAHHLPASYMALLQQGDGPTFGAAHDEDTLSRMIDGQEESGIDVQVLSTGPNSPYLRDADLAVAAARLVNDAYGNVVSRHGGRFAAFGSVPLPHGEAAVVEGVRCLDELGFAGVHVGCSAVGRSLDDPAYAEMWAELNARDAVVFLHPGGILAGSEPGLAGMDDPGIAVTIGSAAEQAVATLKLAALCRTHRRLRVVVALLGGSLPYLIGRVAWLGGRFAGRSVLAGELPDGSLLAELRRFHYDINLLPDPAVLDRARAVYGVDRLLFGSDAPSVAPAVAEAFLRDGGFSDAERRQVRRDNPSTLFGAGVADSTLQAS